MAVGSAFDKLAGLQSRDARVYLGRMGETIGVRTVRAKLQLPVAEHLTVIQAALLERCGGCASVYRESVLHATLSPCAMCSGAIVLYGIPHVVAGEHRSFVGEEDWLRGRCFSGGRGAGEGSCR